MTTVAHLALPLVSPLKKDCQLMSQEGCGDMTTVAHLARPVVSLIRPGELFALRRRRRRFELHNQAIVIETGESEQPRPADAG